MPRAVCAYCSRSSSERYKNEKGKESRSFVCSSVVCLVQYHFYLDGAVWCPLSVRVGRVLRLREPLSHTHVPSPKKGTNKTKQKGEGGRVPQHKERERAHGQWDPFSFSIEDILYIYQVYVCFSNIMFSGVICLCESLIIAKLRKYWSVV